MPMKRVFAISIPGPAAWSLGAIAAFWFAIPGMIQTFMILAGADWAIGAVNAGIKQQFCIRESLEGLWRKVLTLTLIGVAHRVMEPLHMPLDVCNTIAVAFVVNEFISIVLNAADAGVNMPPSLVDFLARIRKYTGRGRTGDQVREEIDGQQAKAAGAGSPNA